MFNNTKIAPLFKITSNKEKKTCFKACFIDLYQIIQVKAAFFTFHYHTTDSFGQ